MDEIRKTFNSLIFTLDTGFLWDFLGKYFAHLTESKYENEEEEEDLDEEEMLTNDERQKRDFHAEKKREHLVLFPVVRDLAVNLNQKTTRPA